MQTQGALLQSQNSSLRSLETQVGQIAQALQARPRGNLPSDTEVTKNHGKEQCSALTLRSGRQINTGKQFKRKEKEETPIQEQNDAEQQEEKSAQEETRENLNTEAFGEKLVDPAAKAAAPPQPLEDARPPPPFPQ